MGPYERPALCKELVTSRAVGCIEQRLGGIAIADLLHGFMALQKLHKEFCYTCGRIQLRAQRLTHAGQYGVPSGLR